MTNVTENANVNYCIMKTSRRDKNVCYFGIEYTFTLAIIQWLWGIVIACTVRDFSVIIMGIYWTFVLNSWIRCVVILDNVILKSICFLQWWISRDTWTQLLLTIRRNMMRKPRAPTIAEEIRKSSNCTVEVWECISNFIPHFLIDVITYPW